MGDIASQVAPPLSTWQGPGARKSPSKSRNFGCFRAESLIAFMVTFIIYKQQILLYYRRIDSIS